MALTLLLSAALLSGCQKKVSQTVGTDIPASQNVPTVSAAGADLIRINGQGFTQADLDFAGLMLKLGVLAQEAAPQEQAEALKRLDNVNIRLDHVIERYAMSLLGQEKHYSVTEAQIGRAQQQWQKQLDARPEMQKLVAEYGQDKFMGRLREYLRQQIIRQRIIQELLADEKRKNPRASAKELDYNTAQAYDLLYQDHADDLDIQINLKGLPPKPAESAVPPQPAPELHVTDAAGNALVLPRPTAKRPLLVNFWATWCGPCREELPLLLQAKASGKYDVLIVNMDESPAQVQAFLAAQNLKSLPVVYTHKQKLSGWVIPGLPTTYLIGEGWTQQGQKFGPLTRADPWMQGL